MNFNNKDNSLFMKYNYDENFGIRSTQYKTRHASRFSFALTCLPWKK